MLRAAQLVTYGNGHGRVVENQSNYKVRSIMVPFLDLPSLKTRKILCPPLLNIAIILSQDRRNGDADQKACRIPISNQLSNTSSSDLSFVGYI